MDDYIEGVCQIVFDHEGTVINVVGDAVHAIFGAPAPQPDQAARAVACALDVDAFTSEFATRRAAEGIPLGVTRIGIHSGPAIVGDFGGGTFFRYTAHGDAINTASRLEDANRHLGTHICVSAATVERVDNFAGRPIGTLRLRGKEHSIDAFEPLREEQTKTAAYEAYLRAFSLAASGDASAVQEFAALVSSNGDDRLATFHLRRLLGGESGIEIRVD